MSRRLTICTFVGLVAISGWRATAAELVVLPETVTLTGPEASHRLLVMDRNDAELAGEAAGVTLSVSDSKVATIEGGVVRPVGNGAATITATTADGRSASVAVTVEKFAEPFAWSFRNHVQPVLTKAACNSGGCHGAAAGQNGFKLSLRGYDPSFDYAAITRHAGGRRIVPTDPGRSLLLLKPTGTVPHKGGVRVEPDSEEYRILAEWIAAGQPAPQQDDPRIERLEILPDVVVLKPGRSQQFVVRAHFGDGRVEDVTRRAKFTATDSTVAKVDDAGKAVVAGHGEGSIVASYLSQNVVGTIRSPFEGEVPAAVFANAPRSNFIDELVLAKLETLRLPPSPPATDTEFLRRVFLDTIGLPPTPEEVRAFLADADPMKRERLVDELLARPEFVDYWAYRWSDLFLVNSEKLKPKQVEAYAGWIREQVAGNTPWDELARQVVTATGSTAEQGAANFFALHQDPQGMAETVSTTFLGMSINCARCHDHPLEKWTNDQYYGMANLFARVRAKGSDEERVIFVSDRGDLVQPQTGEPQPPRPLDAEPIPFEATSDRREYLADWLTSPDNPYFARAVINRVWANFLGVGIVEAVDDLRLTNPPSNIPLFDALEADFVANGYDLKRLMRSILTSQTYQRSSVPLPENAAETRFYSHFYPRRLKAEVLLDATSQAALAATVFKDKPAGTRALQLPDVKVESYFLDTFGRPDRLQTCECERTDMPSMKQVLHLMNGDTLNEKLSRVPDEKKGGSENRIGRALSAGRSNVDIVEEAYLAALGRYPTGEEQARLLATLAEVPDESRRSAIEDLYWGLLTSREFLFQH
ncbi:MAG: DUF1549 and DUF1553 domain-containing protein [Planctomycetaceae bacterium]